VPDTGFPAIFRANAAFKQDAEPFGSRAARVSWTARQR